MPTKTMPSVENTFANWYTSEEFPKETLEKSARKDTLSRSTLTNLETRDKCGRDLFLCIIILFLAFGGLLALLPISSIIAERAHQDPAYFVKRQALWLGLGLVGMLFFAGLRLRLFLRLATLAMLFCISLLGLVFVPGIGLSVPSSHGSFERWLDLGLVSFQPSEFSKIALVCFMAATLSRVRSSQMTIYSWLSPALLVSGMLVAILLEPQYGTTVCMLSVVFLMVFMAGFPLLRLFGLGLAFLPFFGILIFFWQYRLDRIYVWLNPYQYRFEGGYQLVTSFRAFQESGWFGNELASGIAHRYLTYGHTDFALALFAEDFGWIGICVLLISFGLLLWRSFILLQRVDDPFAYLLGSGALIVLMSQILLNLFVVTGLAPTTGVGLPFLSYGGSSLITTLCLCGILLNVTRYSRFVN